MDETWVIQNHCTYYMWLPNDGSDAPKIPSGKGKRLIVLMKQIDLQSSHQLIFKPLKKDNTIHLLVMVTIL
jgi:hypothetical protein